jgi:hypothetical protein
MKVLGEVNCVLVHSVRVIRELQVLLTTVILKNILLLNSTDIYVGVYEKTNYI